MSKDVWVAVLSWDWKEQPSIDEIDRILALINGPARVYSADTGSDQFAAVFAAGELDSAGVQAAYEAWLDHWTNNLFVVPGGES